MVDLTGNLNSQPNRARRKDRTDGVPCTFETESVMRSVCQGEEMCVTYVRKETGNSRECGFRRDKN